jgi:hypothetical protein
VRRSPRKKCNDNNSPVVAAVVAGQKDSTLCTAKVIIPLRDTTKGGITSTGKQTEGRGVGGVAPNTSSGKTPANNKSTTNSLIIPVIGKWKNCNWKQCGIVTSEELQPCPVASCKKQMHPTCMECFAEKGFSKNWFNYETIIDTIVCSKTCYNKHVKRKPTWSNDGGNGMDDPNTSEKILLHWLLVGDNYSNKWHGKDSKGRMKKQVAAELALMMNAAKVRVTHDEKQVMNKIAHIKKSFCCAHDDWANTETGQGLKENDPRAFDDAVRGNVFLL